MDPVGYINSGNKFENRVYALERRGKLSYILHQGWKLNYKEFSFRKFAKTLYSYWFNFSCYFYYVLEVDHPFFWGFFFFSSWFNESQHSQEIVLPLKTLIRLFQIALALRQRKSACVKALFILKGNILFVILIRIHSWYFRKCVHYPKLASLFYLNSMLKNFSTNTHTYSIQKYF